MDRAIGQKGHTLRRCAGGPGRECRVQLPHQFVVSKARRRDVGGEIRVPSGVSNNNTRQRSHLVRGFLDSHINVSWVAPAISPRVDHIVAAALHQTSLCSD